MSIFSYFLYHFFLNLFRLSLLSDITASNPEPMILFFVDFICDTNALQTYLIFFSDFLYYFYLSIHFFFIRVTRHFLPPFFFIFVNFPLFFRPFQDIFIGFASSRYRATIFCPLSPFSLFLTANFMVCFFFFFLPPIKDESRNIILNLSPISKC